MSLGRLNNTALISRILFATIIAKWKGYRYLYKDMSRTITHIPIVNNLFRDKLRTRVTNTDLPLIVFISLRS